MTETRQSGVPQSFPGSVVSRARMWLEVTLERLRLVIASDRGSLDLYALMTLLLLLSLSVPFWYLRGPQVVLVLAGFVLAPLRKNAGFWLVLAVLILIEIYLDWLWLDSFKYLIAYWCLALSCSLRTNNPEKALAATAGWLLGLSFLFAVFRKVAGGDYMDGSFVQYSLLVNRSLQTLATSLGVLTDHARQINDAAVGALLSYESSLQAVRLESSPGIPTLGLLLSWWTLIIEGFLALAFLLPDHTRIARARNVGLLLFVVTAFPVMKVFAFGWVLLILGVAQCGNRLLYTRLAYLLVFVFLRMAAFRWEKIVSYFLEFV